MLELTSSDKTSVSPVNAIISDFTLRAYVGIHCDTCLVLHGYFSPGKISGSTAKDSWQ